MKSIAVATVVLAGVLVGSLQACIDPMDAWSVGVVFSDGETFDLKQIEQAAPDAESYLKVCSEAEGAVTSDCMYKFRSAYAPTVMASVGIFDGPFQQTSDAFRVLLIFDTTGTQPSDEEKAAALEAELNRLIGIGVVALGEDYVQRITAALASLPGQYWTRQDSVLYFNSWFDGTDANSVRGVYGVDDKVITANGCGSGVTYELPASELLSSGVRPAGAARTAAPTGMKLVVKNGAVNVQLSSTTGSGLVLTLSDMAGRRIAALPVAKNAGMMSLPLRGAHGPLFAAGCYLVSLSEGTRTLQSCPITVP